RRMKIPLRSLPRTGARPRRSFHDRYSWRVRRGSGDAGAGERDPFLELRPVRVVAVGAVHDHAAPLPTDHSLAVRAAGPGLGLLEVTLRAEPVRLIEGGQLAALEREPLHVHVDGVAGPAARAGCRRVDRLDVSMRILDPIRDRGRRNPGRVTRAARELG